MAQSSHQSPDYDYIPATLLAYMLVEQGYLLTIGKNRTNNQQPVVTGEDVPTDYDANIHLVNNFIMKICRSIDRELCWKIN